MAGGKTSEAIPSARLIIMAAYHWVAPAPSTEEASLLDYLQTDQMLEGSQMGTL